MKIIRGSEIEYEAASHEDPNDPGVLKKVLGTAADLGRGEVPMLNWSLLRVGKAFQRHYHEDMREIFVIIGGVVDVTVEVSGDIETTQLHGGDAIVIEPREIHSMANNGTGDVTYLVFGISAGKDGKTVVVE
ncbi:MAG: cupin domain-containing protein [Planctomycetota bacterium]